MKLYKGVRLVSVFSFVEDRRWDLEMYETLADTKHRAYMSVSSSEEGCFATSVTLGLNEAKM